MSRNQKTEQIKETYRNALPKPKEAWPYNVKQAYAFIVAHLYVSRLTVGWMKEQCGINRKSFSARFNKHVHWYPKEFMLHHRVEVAKLLLKNTQERVTSIAISVGFNSLSSFDNNLKSREGLTPTQWREQN